MNNFKLFSSGFFCLLIWVLIVSPLFVSAIITEDFSNSFVGIYNTEIFERANLRTNLAENIYSRQFNVPEYKGYIIQLEREPIVVEKHNLNKTAQRNQESLLNQIPVVKNVYSAFAIMPEDVPKRVEKHEQNIQKEREQVKQRILGDLQKAGITGRVISERGELQVGHEFDLVFNGFSLNVSDEEAERIKDIGKVKNVFRNKKYELLLQESVPLIQNGILAGNLDRNGDDCLISGEECLTGEGVTIAIIDTGVDYTHSDLGGCTTEEFLTGNCEKVIGGWDIVSNSADPRDYIGHGTHVAATAAGNGLLKGVAPDAKILAYKVIDTNERGGSSEEIIAAIEKAIVDGADILSLSLGFPCHIFTSYLNCGPDDEVSQAVDNAVLGGKVVVVAAGNSGETGVQTIGSPGTARKAITVGASYNRDGRKSSLYINSDFYESNSFFRTHVGSSFGEIIFANLGRSEDFEVNFYGKIALIKRGEITFNEKVQNAKNSGASGVIIFNNLPPLFLGMVDVDVEIPVVFISGNDGDEISSLLGSQTVFANLSVMLDSNYSNNMANFSSIGPVIGIGPFGQKEIILKPDLVAPGFNICAAFLEENYYCASGTSMATPHVSGVVALLKQKYSDWTPDEIKNTLKKDSNTFNLPSSKQGAGRINLTNTLQRENPIRDYLEFGIFPSPVQEVSHSQVFYSSRDNIFFLGIFPQDFDEISMHYSKLGEQNWKTEGINLVGNEDFFASFSARGNIPERGFYVFKSVLTLEDISKEDYVIVYFDDRLKEGWPLSFPFFLFSFIANPVLGNTVYGSNNLFLSLILNYKTFALQNDGELSRTLESSTYVPPIIDDLNNDGSNEILIQEITLQSVGSRIDFSLFDSSGNRLAGWPFSIDRTFTDVYPPVVSDLNNDGDKEIILTYRLSSNKRKIVVLNFLGEILADIEIEGSPLAYDPIPPPVGDLNNDGNKEIVFSQGKDIYLLNYGNLDVESRLFFRPSSLEDSHFASTNILVANLPSNDKVVFATYKENIDPPYPYWSLDVNNVFYLLDKQGSIMNGWPINLTGNYLGEIVGDLTGDGNPEIILAVDRTLYVISIQGESISNRTFDRSLGPGGHYSIPLVLADVNGDGSNEIIVLNKGIIYFLDEFLLEVESPIFLGEKEEANGLLIDNFGNDDELNLILATTYSGKVFVYENFSISKNSDWPMWRYDSQHTGCYKCVQQSSVQPQIQSKITNHENFPISDTFLLYIEKRDRNQNWNSYREVSNVEITLLAGEVFNLTEVWNNQDIGINSVGDYRLVAEFGGKSAYYEISVLDLPTEPSSPNQI
jgi:subtilisin family serine protease